MHVHVPSRYPGVLVPSVCSLCYHLITHCAKVAPRQTQLFRTLALHSPLLRQLWSSITGQQSNRLFGAPISCLDQLCYGQLPPGGSATLLCHKLTTFSVLLHIYLSVLHDTELTSQCAFTLKELGLISLRLRDIFISLNTSRAPQVAGVPRHIIPPEWLPLLVVRRCGLLN